MPGPFNYNEGISLINNLGKFDSLYGVNIGQYLSHTFGLPSTSIIFLNDAACFALGEYFYGTFMNTREKYEKCIFLTIGSGFGSTFLYKGEIVSQGETVPTNGWVYHVPFKNGIAEDYFSDKWIIKRYAEECKVVQKFNGVSDIPDGEILERVFKEMSLNLVEFIQPWVDSFKATCVCLGGNVVKYRENFLIEQLKPRLNVDVKQSILFENASILGGAAAVTLKLKKSEII